MLLVPVLGLAYGSFSYTKETNEAKIGPIELSVKEKETISIPTWLDAGSIIAGVLLLVVRAQSSKRIVIMTHPSRWLALAGLLLASFCVAPVACAAAYDDPPGRVARLNHVQGEVSYSPAGEDVWVDVMRNRPLIRGDRLWTDRDARADLQLGSAAMRLGPDTSFEILELNDRIAQVQVTQGTVNVRVRRLYPGQLYEVDTPSLAFIINRVGRYRIDVDARGDNTTVVVWEGGGDAYGENGNFPLAAGETVRFYGTDLRDYDLYALPADDDFDRYCRDRDRRLDRSVSLLYLGDDVVGYSDLDEYGSWSAVRSYGTVWFPSRVEAGWAPYRDGHWVWQEPWGWTWVDNAPWGFAPSHYGRWAYIRDRWGWIPGPRNVRPIYAPALVAFVGGRNWSVSLSFGRSQPIGWFPLGPREVYVPSYRTSRDYFTRVNVNNTVINNTVINNVYNNYASGNNTVTQVNYANRAVVGAVTAVPSAVFVNSRPVRQAAIRLDANAGTTGELTRVAPIAPSEHSVIGAGPAARSRPSRDAFDRRVFARNAPPPGVRPFAAREQQLQRNPGRPVEQPAAAAPVRGGDNAPGENVRVLGNDRPAVNARQAGARRDSEQAGGRATAPGQLRQLDRSAEHVRGRGRGERERDAERAPAGQGQPGTGRPAQNEPPQGADQQRAERERQAQTQQQEQRQRQAEREQQQAAEQQQRGDRQRQGDAQQQEQRQRKEENDKQRAAERQRGEREREAQTQQQEQRQRQAEREQQQAIEQRQRGESQRKEENDKQQAAEQQRAQRQQQAEAQQQEQRQRKEESDRQQAAEQQRAQRQQQAEAQQQEQRQRKEESDRQQAAEQQRAQRQQQAEAQQQEQRQAEAQQQEQLQRKAEAEQQAAQQQQQAERQRQAEAQQQEQLQRKAEAEQQAAQQQQQAERQRQAEAQQQEQLQRKAEAEQQAAQQQQQAERQRQAEAQQQQQQQQQQEQQEQQRQQQEQQRQQQEQQRQQQEQQRQQQEQQQQQQEQQQQQQQQQQAERQREAQPWENRGNRGDAPARKQPSKKDNDNPDDPDNQNQGADRP